MTDSPTTETFQPVTSPSPDWSAAANWSDGIVPGAGMTAVIAGTTAAIDPGVTIEATVDLDCGALARFGDELSSQTVSFGAGGGTLVLDDPYLGPGVTIDGMAQGDAIALPTLPDARLATIGNEILILDRTGNAEAGFILGDNVSLAVEDGTAGSTIVAAAPHRTELSDPPCFARGTMILTPSGYRPVEQLAVGDPVITATGKLQGVIWAGSRTLDFATHRAPAKVQPIRLASGALGPGAPHRALHLSPDHAMFLDGVLVPAKLLVNDATIVQETGCLAVTYHHIELAGHDILLAEGAPARAISIPATVPGSRAPPRGRYDPGATIKAPAHRSAPAGPVFAASVKDCTGARSNFASNCRPPPRFRHASAIRP